MRNWAKCQKCGDVIESKSVHDFVECKCGAIFVDGGDEYHRRGGDLAFIMELDDDGKEIPPPEELNSESMSGVDFSELKKTIQDLVENQARPREETDKPWEAVVRRVDNGFVVRLSGELTDEEVVFEESSNELPDDKERLEPFVGVCWALVEHFGHYNSKHSRYNLRIEIEDSGAERKLLERFAEAVRVHGQDSGQRLQMETKLYDLLNEYDAGHM